MLKIRLQRTGRKNQPYFRVVLTDSKNGPQSGKFLEILGSYEPKSGEVKLKGERINHWLSVGAQTSGTMHNFLLDHKIIEGKKKNVLPKKTPIIKEEVKKKDETPVATQEPEHASPIAEEVKEVAPAEEITTEEPKEEPAEPEVQATEEEKVA